MLDIQTDETRNVIMARPEGPLPASAFDTLGQTIDDYASKHDRMPGLVVFLKGVPHWEGMSALRAHFDLVRKRASVLPRVAIVTDVAGLTFLPGLANVFVRARVRQFDAGDQEQAISWAGSPEATPEGYQILEGFPDDVIALRALGEVTSGDYEDKLIPLVRDKAQKHGKLRLLMQIGPEFEGYTAGAMWDDARLGLTHWRSFERIAVVSDIGWITRSIKLFAPLMPGEVAVFPNAAFEAAKVWIISDEGVKGSAGSA
ncbi:STAS/SEC14 domain-containing protein [Paracoccus sp. MBLB3053]|uniref:STAS/SEC14 domain-containing protein n=1 Tax=Paracoccus aurantius TaxID=3073814 RepID=A0ABU2HRJ3_9RHOB|nr:STAS/SEC14 domain-containing protein [Paracoccus sp. MBLB3053]MDS9467647.1 STAS/SEC14 domain-containing protein [Paracoccus sp. MBLB3053]